MSKKGAIPKTNKQGTIPKVTSKTANSKTAKSQPFQFQRSKKTNRSPSNANNQNDSVYLCQICSIEDGVEKVCCDNCTLWYHLSCANVSSDVGNQDTWLCSQCATTRSGGNDTVPREQLVTIEDLIETDPENPSGVSKLPPSMDQVFESQSEARNVTNSNKSHKSGSVTSTVSRRAALALQRLEEERRMIEQREDEAMQRKRDRDKEYLSKKYSILEDDAMSQLSFDDEELDLQKLETVRQWTDSLPKVIDPLPLKDAEESSLEIVTITPDKLSNLDIVTTTSNQQSNLDIVTTTSNQQSNLDVVTTTYNQPESFLRKQFVENNGLAMSSNNQRVMTTQSESSHAKKHEIAVDYTQVGSRVSLPDWLTKPTKSKETLPLLGDVLESQVLSSVRNRSIATSNAEIVSTGAEMTTRLSSTMQAPSMNIQDHLAMAYNQMKKSQMRSSVEAVKSSYDSTVPSYNMFGTNSTLKHQSVGPKHQLSSQEIRSSIDQMSGSNSHNMGATFISNSSTLRPSYLDVPQYQSATFDYQLPRSNDVNYEPTRNYQSAEFNGQPSSQPIESTSCYQPIVSIISQQPVGPCETIEKTSAFNDQYFGSNNQVYASRVTTTSMSSYQGISNQPYHSQPVISQSLPVISQPSMVNTTRPTFNYQHQPSMINMSGPTYSYKSQPSVVYSNGPTCSYQSQPSVVYSNGPTRNYQSQPSVIYSSDATLNYQQQRPVNYTSNFSHQPPVTQTVGIQQSMNLDHRLNQTYHDGTMLAQGAAPNISIPSGLTAEQIAARHVMPKDLPQFYGDPIEWQAFISAFENSTETCGFSNSENLGRLQKCLKGDAKTAVRSRLLHKDSVPGVIHTLKLLFGRPELIIETMIRDIQKIPAPRDDDLASLIKFSISVQNLSATIQELRAHEHLQNPMLINSITDKLPAQFKLNWAFHKQTIGNVNIVHLGDWLYNIADVASQVVRVPSKSNKKPEQKDNDKSNTSKSNNFLNTQVENTSKKNYSKAESNKPCPACKSSACNKLAN